VLSRGKSPSAGTIKNDDVDARGADTLFQVLQGKNVPKDQIDALPARWRSLARYLSKRPPENRLGLLDESLKNDPDRATADRMKDEMVEAALRAEKRAQGQDEDAKSRVTVSAQEVEEKPLEWVWPGRIPLRKLTLFAGENDLGKTLVLCDLAMRITRGVPFPDQFGSAETDPDSARSVVFISGEDDVADTLKPRLRWAGADLNKVRFLVPEALGRWSLADLETLERAVEEAGDAVMLIIDPATAFVGAIDDHRTTQLRAVLTPLSLFTAENGVAAVLVTHTGKSDYRKAADKILGSVGWRNIARSAWMFFQDPDDEGRRLFLRIKGNLCEDVGGLAYTIESAGEEGVRVRWEDDPVKDKADDVLARQKDRTATANRDADRAADWLREDLAAGPKPSGDFDSPDNLVKRGNQKLGIDRRFRWWRDTALKEKLGGKVEKAKGVPNGPWYWCLPGQNAPTLRIFEEVEEVEEAKGTRA
jgi:hypothetical protein